MARSPMDVDCDYARPQDPWDDRDTLDDCTDSQRAMRAHLALHLFNMRGEQLHDAHAYTITVRRYYDELLWITSAPENLAHRLAGAQPSWRPTDPYLGRAGFSFIDSVTGGRLRILGDTGRATPAVFTAWDPSTETCQLHPLVSSIGEDAQTLLAGLVVRMQLDGDEAAGDHSTSFTEPILTVEMSLSRDASGWRLSWNGSPSVAHLTHAFTQAPTRLRGSRLRQSKDGTVIEFGEAKLTLMPHED